MLWRSLALGFAIAVAACGWGGGQANPQSTATAAPASVQAGIVGSVSDAALFIAQDKGYFKEQNLTVTFQRFQSAALMTPALGRGQLEVGAGAPSAGLFNAMARDIDVRIVADKGNIKRGHGYEAYVIRKQLWDSGAIRTPADLRGKTISLAAQGITPEANLDRFLRTGGLSVKDVKIVSLGFADMVPALANGSVDMAAPIEPFATQAESKGIGHIWKRTDELQPGHELGVLIYSADFAKKTDVARRFMLAYLKAARDYDDAFDKKIAAKRADIVKILAANTTVKDVALYDQMVMPGIDGNGALNKMSLKDDQDWFLQYGGQKQKADLDKATDVSFAGWAAQKLGAYR
jgi:NitT/TauT family transport system substrate-binding protein